MTMCASLDTSHANVLATQLCHCGYICPHRCKITVDELARRVGPPEYMSFSSLVAYLRADNNTRKELQAQLEEAGIKPSDLTTEITLFSRLCEGKPHFFFFFFLLITFKN